MPRQRRRRLAAGDLKTRRRRTEGHRNLPTVLGLMRGTAHSNARATPRRMVAVEALEAAGIEAGVDVCGGRMLGSSRVCRCSAQTSELSGQRCSTDACEARWAHARDQIVTGATPATKRCGGGGARLRSWQRRLERARQSNAWREGKGASLTARKAHDGSLESLGAVGRPESMERLPAAVG